MKKLLTDRTTEEFNADWRITHRDVDLDKLENTDILCLPSVEEEYIEKFEGEEDYRTIENAMNLLDELLNEKQKKWFLMSYRDGLSDREISRREGVAQTTVSRGLTVIEKKIKNFSEKAQKYAPKGPKKL